MRPDRRLLSRHPYQEATQSSSLLPIGRTTPEEDESGGTAIRVYKPVINRRFLDPDHMTTSSSKDGEGSVSRGGSREPRNVKAVEDSLRALQDKVADLKSKLRQVENFSSASRLFSQEDSLASSIQ